MMRLPHPVHIVARMFGQEDHCRTVCEKVVADAIATLERNEVLEPVNDG